MRREESEKYKARGEPVPPHLQVQQVRACKELKRQMWELQQQSRQNVRATCWEEIPKPEEAEQKPEEAEDEHVEPEDPQDEAMPERGRSRQGVIGLNLKQGRMGPRSLTPSMSRGTPAKPARGSLKQEEQEEYEEIEQEEEEEEDENPEVKDEKPEGATKRKKRQRPKKTKPAKAPEKKGPEGGGGDGGGKPDGDPPLPPPEEMPPDYSAS